MTLSSPPKRKLTESSIQKAYIKWCRQSNDPRLAWAHSTQTAGYRSIPARMRAKQEGMLAGVADVSIPYPSGKYHGLYLEFKSPTAPKQRFNKPDQLAFRDYCIEHGYQYHMVTSSLEAIRITQVYLSM